MWITDLFVDSPCKPICACYCFLLLCMVISGAAGYSVPSLPENRDYALWKHPVQVDADMKSLALEKIEESVGASNVP